MYIDHISLQLIYESTTPKCQNASSYKGPLKSNQVNYIFYIVVMFFVAPVGLTMVIYQNNFMPNTRDNQILLLVQIV